MDDAWNDNACMMAIIGCNGYNDMKTNKRWDDGFMNLGGLAYYQGKDIVVFRFIIEYSSLRDFDP
jgi:hypothetical protein